MKACTIIFSLCVCGTILCAILAGSGCKRSDPVAPPIDYGSIDTIRYTRDVQPLLNRSCAFNGCHDDGTKAAGLSLTSWDRLIEGSLFGEAVIPSSVSRSLLVTLFDGTVMRKNHPSLGELNLSVAEINFLKRWIVEGARNDHRDIPFEHPAHKVYVPNQGEDNVAVIDVDHLVVSKYVSVGNLPRIEGPHFVVANQHNWYVSLISTGEVWKFDAHTDTLVKVGAVQGSPALLALTPDGSRLYVSQFMTSSTNKISVVNTATMMEEKTISVFTMPHGIRMNHAGTRLYVANMMSDNISVINTQTDEVLETIPLAYDANPFGPAKYMPMEIAVSPNDSIVLVTCSETKEVRMFSATTNTLVDSFTVGDQPWHLQFTPDGEFCYVTNRRENTVSAIHIPMRHVMDTIISPSEFNYPHGCDISLDGNLVFVSNENVGHKFVPRYNVDYPGNVLVIDKNSNQIIKTLEVGMMPTGLSVGQ